MQEQEMLEKAGMEVIKEPNRPNTLRVIPIYVNCKINPKAFKEKLNKRYWHFGMFNEHLIEDKDGFSFTGTIVDEKGHGIFNFSMYNGGMNIIPKYDKSVEGGLRLFKLIKRLDKEATFSLKENNK